jgi:fructose-1,6-bisphosphatase/inositol monophosphatase family enzyme
VTETELAGILTWTKELAKEAEVRVRTLQKKEIHVRAKPDGSLVTDIDRATEQFLRAAITERFPDHDILGEEFGRAESKGAGVPLWAIDPVDGTTNLAHGLPHWGISIGLVADGKPVMGVIRFPELGEEFAGAYGLGATLNGAPLETLPPGGMLTQEDAYGICTTSVHTVSFDRFPARLRLYGSAALDLSWAVAGRLCGAQSVGVSLYDIAAALCFAHEVGAETRWLVSGESYSADKHAASGPVEDDVILTAAPATLEYLRQTLALR